ncbi:MAG: hypothetical protein U9R49_11055 [Bacteroidota bacterium]|nr:hypothetical protein [Bacteroidota bacterium]
MNLIKSKSCSLIVLLFSVLAPLWGQSDYHLNFQGVLTDIEGERISNDQFDLVVKLQYKSDQETLLKLRYSITSDDEGWFNFKIEEISGYILKDGTAASPLVISMEFLPNSNTNWIGQDEDFMVTYSLSALQKEDSPEMQMTRMEGSDLIAHSEEHIYVFKDQYAFAYLTGGFLIADHKPPDEQLLENLKIWISPSEDEESDARSRGVKGGFPTGGYHRTKK